MRRFASKIRRLTRRDRVWAGAAVLAALVAGAAVYVALTPPALVPAADSAAPGSGQSDSAGPSVSSTEPAATSPVPTSAAAAPTPAATRAVPPANRNGCIPKPSSCGFPDASNTGAHGSLSVVQGDVTLRTAGEVYQGKDVRGCVQVAAANVIIRNVKVTCGSSYGIDYVGGGGTLTIEDTTVVCTSTGTSGIGEANLVVRRADVSGCDNAFDLDHDALIQDSWCHDLTDESVVPAAHTDCVQGVMTAGVTIRHNTLIVPFYATSAVGGACTICSGTRVGWVIDGNLMDGGAYTVYCGTTFPQKGTVITNNRFGTHRWTGSDSYATGCKGPEITWSGNVRDDAGQPLAAVA
jgi:hypothetical protein